MVLTSSGKIRSYVEGCVEEEGRQQKCIRQLLKGQSFTVVGGCHYGRDKQDEERTSPPTASCYLPPKHVLFCSPHCHILR